MNGTDKRHQDGERGAQGRWGLAAGRKWPRFLFLLIVLLHLPDANAGPDQGVLLVRSGESSIYRETQEAFVARVAKRCAESPPCPRITTASMEEIQPALRETPQLIVALGHRASMLVAREAADLPQLHALVSRSDHALHRKTAHRASAIYLEQPLKRQLAFIRFLMPEKRRIGVLLSSRSNDQRSRLESLAEQQGFDLQVAEVVSAKQIGKQLRTLTARIDSLLALPDPTLYNSKTLAGILLTAYRDNIPVIGFSAGMVKAGAIAGIYSSPQTAGTEAADAGLGLLRGEAPFEAYPTLFEARVNRSVARALHIRLPTDSQIADWRDTP